VDLAELRSARISRAEEAYTALRDLIVRGSLAHGTHLSEPALARALGMSRTPVREALHRLKLEGRVEPKAGLGLFVRELAPQAAVEIVGIRAVLEAYAARLAATRMSEDELSALRAMLASSEEADESEDLERLADCNTRFHDAIVAGSGSHWCVQMVGELRDWVLAYRAHSLSHHEVRAQSRVDHARILAALTSRDGVHVETLMREHVLTTTVIPVEHLGSLRPIDFHLAQDGSGEVTPKQGRPRRRKPTSAG
jgi:DNA-binding GntR family transcriptional regulator